jgi:hypothetical protein
VEYVPPILRSEQIAGKISIFRVLFNDFIAQGGLDDCLSQNKPTFEADVHVISPQDFSAGYTPLDELKRIVRKHMVWGHRVSLLTHAFFA